MENFLLLLLDGERLFYLIPRFSSVKNTQKRLGVIQILAYLSQFSMKTMLDVSARQNLRIDFLVSECDIYIYLI